MSDNAPNAVIPGGNIVHGFHHKIKMHIATITGANGSATVNQLRSSAGITVTYVSEGLYTLGFPADTTGSIGWALVCPPQVPGNTGADTKMFAIDSDTVNYATGVITVTASDVAAASDVIGDFTVIIFVLPA